MVSVACDAGLVVTAQTSISSLPNCLRSPLVWGPATLVFPSVSSQLDFPPAPAALEQGASLLCLSSSTARLAVLPSGRWRVGSFGVPSWLMLTMKELHGGFVLRWSQETPKSPQGTKVKAHEIKRPCTRVFALGV